MRYAQITPFEVCNGKGAGVSLFVQGCHFHCKGCFNQESWDFCGGKEWTKEIEDKFLKNSLNEKNILKLKQTLKEYLNFDELTPELINSLIDHITLSHIKVINGVKTRNIKIAYKYVS